MAGKPKDITGQRFGFLVALHEAPNTDGYARWLCKCDCGNEVTARGHTLRNGREYYGFKWEYVDRGETTANAGMAA